MAKPPSKKTSEPAPPTTSRVLPMEFRVSDQFADDSGEWEVVGPPFTAAGGKLAHARVQRVGDPSVTAVRT